MKQAIIRSVLLAGAAAGVTAVQASSDYSPAIWHACCNANWYTSGYGHKFCVIHDMEGYYLSTVSYMTSCSHTSSSVYYAVNGLTDSSDNGAPPGEITQMVLEAYYAWHACCWNQYAYGTEHEGFASNPAWYTDAMYNASGLLQRHLCDVHSIAKDRNHIVAHGEKSNANWVAYCNANFGCSATCNTHTDPGPYWDWNKLMGVINPSTTTIIVDNANSGFSCSANWATGSSATDKYGADYRYHSAQAVSDDATFTANLPSAGSWTVYVWYPEGSNRCTATPFVITTSGGNHTEYVNQQITGGQWVNQGAYSMNAGNNTVKVSCWVASGIVVADAVKWVK